MIFKRLAVRVGAGLGFLAFAASALVMLVPGPILNRYLKSKMERAFAKAYPGWILNLGKLEYLLRGNILSAQSVAIASTNATLATGKVSVTGARWAGLYRDGVSLSEVLAEARLEVTNINVEFVRAQYRIQCERLRASVPGNELKAEGAELRTLSGDDSFFAADEFRTTRYHVGLPEIEISDLVFDEMIKGKPWRAGSVRIAKATFDALANCEKPARPYVKPPLMPLEALAAIGQPLRIDNLSVIGGRVTYCERMTAGAAPGVLTFGDVNITAEGIANYGDSSSAIRISAQGRLMDAGLLDVRMTIPIVSPVFSMRYEGSLGGMDLTSLNAFLDIAELTRIKSGAAQEAAFEIDVADGVARGRVRGIYRNLKIALLDKNTGVETGLINRFASFFANMMKIRNSNIPGASGVLNVGEVIYTRKPKDTFMQFIWFALRTGVMDIVNH